MLAAALALLLAAAAVAGGSGSAGGGPCASSLDCFLNGECQASQCVCDSAWEGAQCGWLALADEAVQLWPPPASPPPSNASLLASSWGATLLRDPASGVFHAFFDVVCGAYTWMHVQGAVIVHATAPAIEGPYSFADVALPQQTINPHLTRAPAGTYLLAHCHDLLPAPLPVCTGDYAVDEQRRRAEGFRDLPALHSTQPSDCRGNNPGAFQVASAAALAGPWAVHNKSISGGNASIPNPNPSLAFDSASSGGGVHVAFTRNPPAGSEQVNVAAAADWTANDFSVVGGILDPLSPGNDGEDPMIYRSARGWHIVFHRFGSGADVNNTGGYAVSTDPASGKWRVVPGGIYNTTVKFRGEAAAREYARRERPEFLFDAAGAISHLLTGLELVRVDGHSSLSVLHAVRA